MQDPLKNVMVTLPTYNESENIEKICLTVFERYPGIKIVVIDDNSPDRTWEIVEKLKKNWPNLFLIRRLDQKGRGTAGRDGFLFALQEGAQFIIEMDADFSHNPRYIAEMLNVAAEDKVVIGSRLVPGGGEVGRNPVRRWITLMANWYIRIVLGLKIRDCTSGYRMFPRNILKKIDLESLSSTGPEIVQEILYRCRIVGAEFCEIPILFEERAAGTSTFNVKIMIRSLFFVLSLRFSNKFDPPAESHV